MGRQLAIAGALLLATACHERPAPRRPSPRPTVRVRAITDAQPVRMMTPVGTYLFAVGPHGVDRWDPLTDRVLPLSQDHGLPGDHVLALAADVERVWLWIATDGGLGYYDVTSETFTEVPAGKLVDLATARDGELHLAAAIDGGVWIGHPRGLFYANPAGQWNATPLTGAISALAVGEAGGCGSAPPTAWSARRRPGRSSATAPTRAARW
jgi:hypothetical protein